MIEGLSEAAELRLKVIFDGLKNAEKDLREFNEETEGVSRKANEAERDLGRLNDRLSGTGKSAREAERGMSGLSKRVTEGSEKWQKYVQELENASKAYKEFRRGEVTGEGGGKSADEYGIDELRQYIATSEAMSASFISEARHRISAIEAEEAALRRRNQEAIRASNSAFMCDNLSRGNIVGQGNRNDPGPAPRAADTGLAAMLRAEAEADELRAKAAKESAEAQDRAAAATTRREQAEMRLNRARTRSDNRSAASAWDAEFAALDKLTKKTDEYATGSLPRLRYALYDVATTYGIVSAALLATSGLIVGSAADFESSFSNVERTMEPGRDSISAFREELVNLSTEIPKTFDELSKIATLGNQLGVPAGQIEEFTRVVAQFSTVTGMTVDATAQAFGRLANILGLDIGRDAEALGSAIALAGRRSESTEQQIVALAERLGSTATRAGFTADQVVGLSAALGSLGVAPERAQGVFETYFNSLNESLAEGGEKLEAFSIVTGLTVDQLNELVRTGQGFEVFQKFLAGLQGADTVELTSALDALGLSGLRANEVIGRISDRLPVLKQSFADASQGMREQAELSRQYAIIADDLNSQLQILWQSLLALYDAGAGELIPGLAGAIGGLADLVNGAREFAETDLGGNILRVGLALVTLVGVYTAYKSASALATASTAALITANAEVAATGGRAAFGMRGLATALFQTRGAAVGATTALAGTTGATAALAGASTASATGLNKFTTASLKVGKGLGWLALLTWGINLLTNFNQTMADTVGMFYDIAVAATQTSSAVQDFYRSIGNALGPLGGVWNGIADAAESFDKGALSWLKGVRDDFRKAAAEENKLTDATYDAGDAMDYGADMAGGFADGLGDVGDGAGAAAAEVRTLVDYAADLESVFSRSFDIRFGTDQSQDAIASSWNAIAKEIEETNQQIREYQATMSQLSADKAVKEFWLSVAEGYGDGLRADVLRGDLAEIEAKLAETSGQITTAQEKNSKSLVGNSDAAIANRAELLNLVGQYQDYIVQLAESGAGQDELIAASQRAKQEFIDQAIRMGYSRAEVEKYAVAFDDLRTVIEQVPRNITVDANADPALQALNEFFARARAMIGAGIDVPITSSANVSGIIAALQAEIALREGKRDAARAERLFAAANEQQQAIWALQAKLSQIRGYRTGGWTGNGGENEIAGFVHGQEYVVDAASTRALGGPNALDALIAAARSGRPFGVEQMAFPQMPSAVSKPGKSAAATGPMTVMLHPYDRQLLSDIADAVGVEIDGDAFQRVAGHGFVSSSRRGTR